MSAVQLDHYYVFADVYTTLDTCEELDMLLGRLRRQHLLSDEEWMQSRHQVSEIRSRLQETLDQT